MSRESLDESLNEIKKSVVQMGELVSEMIRLGCDAACQGNPDLALRVVAMDERVDRHEDETLRAIVVTTMRMAPVAHDLQFLIATINILSEIEEAGDDAAKLAGRAAKVTSQFPSELKSLLAEMGEDVRVLFGQTLRLYLNYSPEEADEIIVSDDRIDQKFKDARTDLFDRIQADPEAVRSMMRSIGLFHALEHVADHAVEMARRLKFHFGHAESASPSRHD